MILRRGEFLGMTVENVKESVTTNGDEFTGDLYGVEGLKRHAAPSEVYISSLAPVSRSNRQDVQRP